MRLLSQNFEHVFCIDRLNILFAVSSNTFSSEWLHNLWDPVQNENAEPLIQKLRISTWRQQRVKPSTGPSECPPWKLALLRLPIALKRNKEQGAIPLLPLPPLPRSHKKEEDKKSKKGTQRKINMKIKT